MIRTNDSQMTTDPYQPNHRLFKLLLDLGQPLTRGSARHLLPSPMAPLPTIITGQTHSLTPPGMMAMILKMNLGRSLDHCKTRDPSGDDSMSFPLFHPSFITDCVTSTFSSYISTFSSLFYCHCLPTSVRCPTPLPSLRLQYFGFAETLLELHGDDRRDISGA